MIPLYTKEKKTTKTMRRSPSKRKNLIITFVSYLNENSRRMERSKKKKKNENKRKKDYCEKRDSLNHKD